MNHNDSSSGTREHQWIVRCEECLRIGNLAALNVLLDNPAAEVSASLLTFYATIVQVITLSQFEAGAEEFQTVARQARAEGDTYLRLRSLVWEAYCRSLTGDDPRARSRLMEAEAGAPKDDPLWSMIYYVYGVITGEKEHLAVGKNWYEKALSEAQRFGDIWMEARASANLAWIYGFQGRLDDAGLVIRRVEKIHQRHPMPVQLRQIRNIELYHLCWRGVPENAVQTAELILRDQTEENNLFGGYIALTAAMAATDLGNFKKALALWSLAEKLLPLSDDDGRLRAELAWDRAWIQFREGYVAEAAGTIVHALKFIHGEMELEIFHALALAGIINAHLQNPGIVGVYLGTAVQRFRYLGHQVALAGVLFHESLFHLRNERETESRACLAEALTIMHAHRLFGTYHWDPNTMVILLKLAMQEDIWADAAVILASKFLGKSEESVRQHYLLDGGPANAWSNYAASLAASRLGSGFWQEFAELLGDPRWTVRRRAVQVLGASLDPQALAELAALRDDPAPEVRRAVAPYVTLIPSVQIFSLGRFEVLIGGEQLHKARNASSKSWMILGVLLIVGEAGIEIDELATLIWPHKAAGEERRNNLYGAISVLRKLLGAALTTDGKHILEQRGGRYYLRLNSPGIWWDWNELRQIARRPDIDEKLQQRARQLYHESFMLGFFDAFSDKGADKLTAEEWDALLRSIQDRATDFEIQAADWVATIGIGDEV